MTIDQARWSALGTYVQVSATGRLPEAASLARELLVRVDRACSRFRRDSDLSRANRAAGRPVDVDPLLILAVEAAIEVAQSTDGLVHPLLGDLLVRFGYDRTFSSVALTSAPTSASTSASVSTAPVPRDAWRGIRTADGRLSVPAGYALDLGATGKAWAADLVAETIARELDEAVIVSLGGDIAVAAPHDSRPEWSIEVREHPDAGEVAEDVWISQGGLATSSTRVRRWTSAGVHAHHLIDPRTGRPAADFWRTVTASGPSAVAANAATTAAIVLGQDAVGWLTERGVAARLVSCDGRVTRTPGWPDKEGHTHELTAALVR